MTSVDFFSVFGVYPLPVEWGNFLGVNELCAIFLNSVFGEASQSATVTRREYILVVSAPASLRATVTPADYKASLEGTGEGGWTLVVRYNVGNEP